MADEDKDFKELILDGFREMKKTQNDLNKCLIELTTEFKLHKQESQMRWEKLTELDEEQNELLAEHSSRSTAIQKDNALREEALRRDMGVIEKRVVALEEPRKISRTVLKFIKKVAVYVTAVGGSMIVVSKVMGLW